VRSGGALPERAERRDPCTWQTVLFVPGDRPEMLAKAQGLGADAIVVDLEDAVAAAAKAEARILLAELLKQNSLAGPSAVCVRVNAIGEGVAEDLAALAGTRLDAVVLPKSSDPAGVAAVRASITQSCADGASIRLVPQVESVHGVLGVADLARIDGVSAIAFGGEDFCVDLGVARSEESLELLLPRALVALRARAANLPAIDTVYTALADEAGLLREAITARQLGFSGKLLIHPAQIEPVRRVFAPSEDELAWARRVLTAEAAAPGDGVGVRVVDGKMVDAPVLTQAERILARER
jgi:citrate lyase subunit beta/citryl-CoA lyase